MLLKPWVWRLLSTRLSLSQRFQDETASAFSTLIELSRAVRKTSEAAQETEWLVAMTMHMEVVRSHYLTWDKMCGTHGAANAILEGSVRMVMQDQIFRCLRIFSAATGAARHRAPRD